MAIFWCQHLSWFEKLVLESDILLLQLEYLLLLAIEVPFELFHFLLQAAVLVCDLLDLVKLLLVFQFLLLQLEYLGALAGRQLRWLQVLVICLADGLQFEFRFCLLIHGLLLQVLRLRQLAARLCQLNLDKVNGGSLLIQLRHSEYSQCCFLDLMYIRHFHKFLQQDRHRLLFLFLQNTDVVAENRNNSLLNLIVCPVLNHLVHCVKATLVIQEVQHEALLQVDLISENELPHLLCLVLCQLELAVNEAHGRLFVGLQDFLVAFVAGVEGLRDHAFVEIVEYKLSQGFAAEVKDEVSNMHQVNRVSQIRQMHQEHKYGIDDLVLNLIRFAFPVQIMVHLQK